MGGLPRGSALATRRGLSRQDLQGPSEDGHAQCVQPTGMDAAVLSTDLMKAYDSVQLEVLYTIASRLGGDGYATWLRTLYTGLVRSIMICAGSGDDMRTVLSPPKTNCAVLRGHVFCTYIRLFT